MYSCCVTFDLTCVVLFFMPIGVGTRNYYRKIGYELEGPYMIKALC